MFENLGPNEQGKPTDLVLGHTSPEDRLSAHSTPVQGHELKTE